MNDDVMRTMAMSRFTGDAASAATFQDAESGSSAIAAEHVARAEAAMARGDIRLSGEENLLAAKGFLTAAGRVGDMTTATALLLLSSAHARRAQEARRLAELETAAPSTKPPVNTAAKVGKASSVAPVQLSKAVLNDSILGGWATAPPPPPAPTADSTSSLRDCIDDIKELEIRLSALGLGKGRAGGSGTSGSGAGMPPPRHPNPSRYMASTLGESFCLLNQSVGPSGVALQRGGSPVGAAFGNTRTSTTYGAGINTGGGINTSRRRGRGWVDDNASGNASSLGASQSPKTEVKTWPTVEEMSSQVIRSSAISNSSVLRPNSASGTIGRTTAGRTDIIYSRDSPSTGNNTDEDSASLQSEILRLLRGMQTLGDENALLLKEAEDCRHVAAEAKQEMNHFKRQFKMRFQALSQKLEEHRKQYPAGLADIATADANTEITGVRSAELEQKLALLSERLQRESELMKLKDSKLQQWETWYRRTHQKSSASGRTSTSATGQPQPSGGQRTNGVSQARPSTAVTSAHAPGSGPTSGTPLMRRDVPPPHTPGVPSMRIIPGRTHGGVVSSGVKAP